MISGLLFVGVMSLLTTLAAIVLAMAGGAMVVARGRGYAGFIVGALLLLAAMTLHSVPTMLTQIRGVAPPALTGWTDTSLFSIGLHFTESVVLGLAWVAILFPVLRPDSAQLDLERTLDDEMGA